MLVAGGGALGAAVAFSLVRAGATVTLLDPGPPEENASGIAAGMLAPAFESLFDSATPEPSLLRQARDLWPDLATSLGLAIDTGGAMAVGEAQAIDAWNRDAAALGVEMFSLPASSMRERSPWLTTNLAAIWTPEDWRLAPLDALWAFRRVSARMGARWLRGAVASFEPGVATLDDGRLIESDALVIATGYSSSLVSLAPELGVLTPIKGHILRFPSQPLSGPVVRLRDAYICPGTGGALIGSTMEPGRDDVEIDPAAVERLRGVAAAAAPGSLTANSEARAGVRAATPDGLPLVGRAGVRDVWLAVGARRNGWLLAPLVAQMIADDIAGAPRSPHADRFDPRRFQVRVEA